MTYYTYRILSTINVEDWQSAIKIGDVVLDATDHADGSVDTFETENAAYDAAIDAINGFDGPSSYNLAKETAKIEIKPMGK